MGAVKKGTKIKQFLNIVNQKMNYKLFTGDINLDIHYLKELRRQLRNFDIDYRVKTTYGRNLMSFDLGLYPNFFNDIEYISKFIEYIDKTYKLVLIMERMGESLILLRHILCWSLEDIVSFHHNPRIDRLKKESNELSDSDIEIIRKFNRADDMLYHYFSKKFDILVDKFGRQKIAQEVEHLKILRNKYYGICVEKVVQLKSVQPSKLFQLLMGLNSKRI